MGSKGGWGCVRIYFFNDFTSSSQTKHTVQPKANARALFSHSNTLWADPGLVGSSEGEKWSSGGGVGCAKAAACCGNVGLAVACLTSPASATRWSRGSVMSVGMAVGCFFFLSSPNQIARPSPGQTGVPHPTQPRGRM